MSKGKEIKLEMQERIKVLTKKLNSEKLSYYEERAIKINIERLNKKIKLSKS